MTYLCLEAFVGQHFPEVAKPPVVGSRKTPGISSCENWKFCEFRKDDTFAHWWTACVLASQSHDERQRLSLLSVSVLDLQKEPTSSLQPRLFTSAGLSLSPLSRMELLGSSAPPPHSDPPTFSSYTKPGSFLPQSGSVQVQLENSN